MKILMLVNWKVKYVNSRPDDIQAPDYYMEDAPYWFYRFFQSPVHVDVADISSCNFIEKFEKSKLRFYVLQTLKVFPRLQEYDLLVSHGMQSGIFLCMIRKLFHINKPCHVVFDIGAFNSAAEKGGALKLMQWVSKSLDGVIYHTSMQKNYYEKYFPWLLKKSKFIPFGTDEEWFRLREKEIIGVEKDFVLCIGYHKRDWDTLIKAYELSGIKNPLVMVGNGDIHVKNSNIKVIPFVAIIELLKLVKEACYCVLPLEYLNYSFGQMTLQQQMVFGKAVITADVPSMKDYVIDGETAVLYESGNIDDLALKLNQLSENADMRRKLGENARRAIELQFNEQNMAEQIESFFRLFMEEKGGNS